MKTTSLALALLLSAAASAPAAASASDDFYWSGTVARGKTVEIRNINGAILAEPAQGNTLEVTATRRAKKSDPRSVRIEVAQSGDHVTFCALYPTTPGYPPNTCDERGRNHTHTKDNDVRVEFRIKVPAGVRLEAHTVNGDVRALGMTASVEAKTVNGEVRVETTSWAEASTVNGSVEVAMGGRGWPDGLDFRTVNGDIHLDVDGPVDADLRAETMNGAIESDYPLTLQGKLRKNRVRATIGRGGPELALATLNGSIELRRAAR
jgi:DUF4097 and DUF4098 domain-containing protein YvlB